MEEAQSDAMHGVGGRNWDAGRSVPGKDTGPDSKEQLPAVLGKSEVLRNRRGGRQAVSMAERSSTASVRSVADERGYWGYERAGL